MQRVCEERFNIHQVFPSKPWQDGCRLTNSVHYATRRVCIKTIGRLTNSLLLLTMQFHLIYTRVEKLTGKFFNRLVVACFNDVKV